MIEKVLLMFLATYRVARFLVVDGGPFQIMTRLRDRYEIGILHCIHCAGMWIAPIMYLLYVKKMVVVIILAVAGALSLWKDTFIRDD